MEHNNFIYIFTADIFLQALVRPLIARRQHKRICFYTPPRDGTTVTEHFPAEHAGLDPMLYSIYMYSCQGYILAKNWTISAIFELMFRAYTYLSFTIKDLKIIKIIYYNK